MQGTFSAATGLQTVTLTEDGSNAGTPFAVKLQDNGSGGSSLTAFDNEASQMAFLATFLLVENNAVKNETTLDKLMEDFYINNPELQNAGLIP